MPESRRAKFGLISQKLERERKDCIWLHLPYKLKSFLDVKYLLIKNTKVLQGMLAHIHNPNTQKAVTGGLLRMPGQPRLLSMTLPQKRKLGERISVPVCKEF